MFDLGFSDRPADPGSAFGYILLSEAPETFLSQLGPWTEDDYRRWWRAGVERALAGHTSALITSRGPDEGQPFLVWWPLYPEGDAVYVQQQLLIERPAGWSWDAPWAHVEPRDPSVSEWAQAAGALRAWLEG